MISVALPVGPLAHHQRYLEQCLQSVMSQTDDVLVIDDMAELPLNGGFRVYRPPWRLGCAAAWNCGIALAKHELVFMMGADDWLEPDCLYKVEEAWRGAGRKDGYYHVKVRYTDGREQDLPCNAAAVTKGLWNRTGGFPPEAGIGAPDALFISMMLGRPGLCEFYPVGDKPLYNVRVHPDQDTATRGPFQGPILAVRNIMTATWQPPEWGRYI